MSDRYSFRATTTRKRLQQKQPENEDVIQESSHRRAQENSTNLSATLLSLPPELRLMIWTYALGGIRIRPKRATRVLIMNTARGRRYEPYNYITIGLERTCRQIYSELGKLFYRPNTFCFDDYDSLLHFRIKLTRAQLENVRRIAVSVPVMQRLYAPPVDGRIARSFGALSVIGVFYYQWRNNTSTPWPTFSSMFQELQSITVTKPWNQGLKEVFLEFVRAREEGKCVSLEEVSGVMGG